VAGCDAVGIVCGSIGTDAGEYNNDAAAVEAGIDMSMTPYEYGFATPLAQRNRLPTSAVR
jgi:hypothetical protein